eukprot:5218540-Pyramimonas_sp.AAC.1
MGPASGTSLRRRGVRGQQQQSSGDDVPSSFNRMGPASGTSLRRRDVRGQQQQSSGDDAPS